MTNELGRFLTYKRGKKSLREYAKFLGISHAYLNILEKGEDPNTHKEASPSIDVIQKIAKKTDVSAADILDMVAGVSYEKVLSLQYANEMLKKAENEAYNPSDKDEFSKLFNQNKNILTDDDKETIKFLIEKRIREVEKQK